MTNTSMKPVLIKGKRAGFFICKNQMFLLKNLNFLFIKTGNMIYYTNVSFVKGK